jgi:hypothetical protein
MEQTESRLAKDMRQWDEIESNFKKSNLLDDSKISSKVWQKDKLDYYNGLRGKHADSKNLNDRMAMRVLQLEKRELERKLYPNLVVRLLVRLLDGVTLQGVIRENKSETDLRIKDIGEEMKRAGFAKLIPKMEQQLKQGNRDFTLPVSYGVSGNERMDYLLHFKNSFDGKCHFESYKATLISQDKTTDEKRQVFENQQGKNYSADQAYQLLSGRSIKDTSGSWQKLDFNDKDANGNYRHKHFNGNYGFDLRKEMQKLPIEQNQSNNGLQRLINRLQNGERVDVMLNINGKIEKYGLEANPQKKEVGIIDGSGRHLTLQELKSGSKPENKASNVRRLVPQKTNTQARRNGKAIKR